MLNNNLFVRTVFFLILTVFAYSLVSEVKAQSSLNLSEVIDIAHSKSIEKLQVKNSFENKYWRYYSFKKSYLPEISLEGSLPDFNTGLSDIVQPDGTTTFIRTSQMSSNLGLSINQPISLTGGNLFVSTNLMRLDLLGNNPYTSYRSSPFYIGISQPLLKFNSYKWDKKIEPMFYEEAKRLSIEESEEVSITAVRLFFDVITKESYNNLAKLNMENSDTLYRISKGRYQMGKIAENELLQIELTLLNAEKSLEQSELNLQISKQQLQSFLKISFTSDMFLRIDTLLPLNNVDVDKVVELAKNNRSEFIAYERSITESFRDLDRVKKENSFNMDIFAAYGVAQTAPVFSDVYQDLLHQETVRIGVKVPILNWGQSKANIKQQKANTELIQNQVEQAQKDFERYIFTSACQFNIMAKQIKIAQKAMIVARKRYDVSKQLYLIGKSDILSFNNSLQERNQAIDSYYQTYKDYWVAYYSIRKLTHFDFVENVPLEQMSIE